MPIMRTYLRATTNFFKNYLQLWQSYAILSVTIQFIPYAKNVHHRPTLTLAFSDIFPNSWEFLVQN